MRTVKRADYVPLPTQVAEVVWRAAEVICDLYHDNPVDHLPCLKCLRTAQRDILDSQRRREAA